jgi:signal transduction histidine kinase
MKKRRSLYFKNFINNACIVILSFVILGGVFSYSSYKMLLQQQESSMRSTANELVRSISAYNLSWELDSIEVRMFTTAVGSTAQKHILVTDSTGTVVSCSDTDFNCDDIGMEIPMETILHLAGQSSIEKTNLGGVYSAKKYVICRPIISKNVDEAATGYVFLSGGDDVMSVLWRDYFGLFVFLALVVMFFTFAASYLTTKRQTEPIKQIALIANRFARGDFSSRVDYDGNIDEVAAMTNSFNKMADSIEKSESMRREFIANVSHELKTPMTSIAGFADGIIDGTIPHSRQNEYLAIISSETRRLSRLVRSMLDMSQLQAQDKGAILSKKFDICEVMRLALLSLEHKITDKNLDVIAQIPEEPIIVRGDKDAINQVVYNLIDNAAKFAPAKTALTIAAWKQGQKAFVSVQNYGETISQEELPLIFDRFHKTDKSRSMDKDGVGLGLYIVKTILDNHNEDIYVTSADGVTKFVFTMTITQ